MISLSLENYASYVEFGKFSHRINSFFFLHFTGKNKHVKDVFFLFVFKSVTADCIISDAERIKSQTVTDNRKCSVEADQTSQLIIIITAPQTVFI